MDRRHRKLVIWALALGSVPGLGLAGAAEPVELLVSAAISLEPAMREVVAEFRADGNPDVGVALNTGGSSILMQQIRRGAPSDIYVGASSTELDRLNDEGRIVVGSRRAIASNTLVVVGPKGRPAPASLAELAEPRHGRIAMANPRTAPLGRYSEAALRNLGLLPDVRSRVILAENARQVLDWVARGEAVGVVYLTDARLRPDRVSLGPTVPQSAYPKIQYEGAVVADTRYLEPATAFLDYLASERGRAILLRHGFTAPR